MAMKLVHVLDYACRRVLQNLRRNAEVENNNIEVIGVDYGWSHVKTATTVFTTSIEENPSPTFFKDVLVSYQNCKSFCLSACYSAVTEMIPNFQRSAVVVDIGS